VQKTARYLTLTERPGGADRIIPRGFREATLLFADVVHLADLASGGGPEQVVAILDDLFRAADLAVERFGLTRVGLPGAAYAAVSGVPDPRPDHARAAVEAALDITEAAAQMIGGDGQGLALRIGIHTGPVVAAIGDGGSTVREVWGESARLARLMETSGVPGHIQVSGATAGLLAGRFRLESRLRPSGHPETYLLSGRRA